ncbi:MAG: hypothetical protein KAS90_02025 [Candidatus Aenigmarchaeota archaeon]|nr:hypothetical protein [Candidatus Aenigmarchaeota archaeon]
MHKSGEFIRLYEKDRPLSENPIDALWDVYTDLVLKYYSNGFSCCTASDAVEKLGYPNEKWGHFKVDLPKPDFKFHCYNYCPDGDIIDLTVEQFNGRVKGVEFRKGVLIVKKGTELYERYRPSGTLEYTIDSIIEL